MDIPGVKAAEPFYANTIVWKHPQTRRNHGSTGGFNPDHSAFNLPEVNQQLQTETAQYSVV